MQREIKFRAWTIKEKIMVDLKKITPFALVEGMPDGLFIPFDELCILMQFTGLKDKNGKEIYEGDIVKYTFDKEYIHPVIWRGGEDDPVASPGFLIDTGTKYGHSISVNSIFSGGYEVIGNIYENPELLNQ